jgi:D-mannonate dehydratase
MALPCTGSYGVRPIDLVKMVETFGDRIFTHLRSTCVEPENLPRGGAP